MYFAYFANCSRTIFKLFLADQATLCQPLRNVINLLSHWVYPTIEPIITWESTYNDAKKQNGDDLRNRDGIKQNK